MNDTIKVIDLGDYRVEGNLDFASRTRGIAVRTKSDIDTLARYYQKIVIKVPKEVYSISQPFLKEFLGNLIHECKTKEKFFNKVDFEPQGRYKVKAEVEEVVEDLLEFAVTD